MQRLLINAGPIAHMAGDGPIIGNVTDESAYVSEAGLAILIDGFVIEKIGPTEELLSEYSQVEILDLEGKAVIPGLVDSHTHLLWSGDRSREV